ncbi:MAG: preprotein translocase subunit SecY, partial [Thermoprotei archaeon]
MRAIDVLAPPGNAIPGPRKPAKKTSLTEKLIWTGVVLVLYLVMSDIPLYGISSSVSSAFAQLNAFRIIFASTNGTLMQLGIGPIVT